LTAPRTPENDTEVISVARTLLAYCRQHDWAGYDPYDALNSKLFAAPAFLNNRIPRILLTQALKRSPINVRPLLRVPKTLNPKAIALFLSALLRLSTAGVPDQHDDAGLMLQRLAALRSPHTSYWCWGYSFPWQTRTIVVPAWSPNLVCTAFVAQALFDAHEQRPDAACLAMAVGAAEYILNELYWADGDFEAGFAYPVPSARTQVHNANFLGAAVLTRAYEHTRDERYLFPALRVAHCSTAQQHADGGWSYGEGLSLQWIDNFHTGYNHCALRQIDRSLKTGEFEATIQRGLDFYTAHFFREDGAPRYFHDRTYPLDIHSVAQSIITLLALADLDPAGVLRAHAVFRWAMKHMWDERGFFYYRRLRCCTIRTSYMRWSQAWMLQAIASLLSETKDAA
jgi:hypothetical protein